MMDELTTIEGELTTADLVNNGATKQPNGLNLVKGQERETLESNGYNFGAYNLVF